MIATRGVTKLVNTNRVQANPWNFNRMSEPEEKALRESLEEYGQVVPLAVRSIGDVKQVLDGEHRLAVIKESGAANLLVHDLGEMEDAHAKKLSVILMTTHGKPDFEAARDFLHAFRTEHEWDPADILRGLPNAVEAFDLDFDALDGGTDDWDPPEEREDVPTKRKFEFAVSEEEGAEIDAALEAARARLGDETASKARAFVEMAKGSITPH